MSGKSDWPSEAIYAMRTASQHHVQLSMMADNKANMLIGATFVVFTLAIGQAGTGSFTWSLIILAFTSFISAAMAIFAVMPSFMPSKQQEPNLLFFGSFTAIPEEEYIEKMLRTELATSESTFRAMLHDMYQMGQILVRKKYRYLGLSYRIFLIGMIATFAIFVAEQAAARL